MILGRVEVVLLTISIHALLAESDQAANSLADTPPQISIHALLAESDLSRASRLRRLSEISIHALLAESDRSNGGNHHSYIYFYPRSPCGERHKKVA